MRFKQTCFTFLQLSHQQQAVGQSPIPVTNQHPWQQQEQQQQQQQQPAKLQHQSPTAMPGEAVPQLQPSQQEDELPPASEVDVTNDMKLHPHALFDQAQTAIRQRHSAASEDPLQ